MHIFIKFFKSITTLLGILLLLTGCGSESSSTNYPTTLGDAASIISDINATMAPSPTTLKSINNTIATIIKTDVDTQNQKEATTFTKEILYCDISGVVESTNEGTLATITKIQKFNACKDEQHLQDGFVTINYDAMRSEGKFPQIVTLRVEEDYTFNEIVLKKGTLVKSSIEYNNDNTIALIKVTTNGNVEYQYGNYQLINDSDSLSF